ncbi:unnamed protein product [Clonostachys solani]|uniref:Carnitinyl-CoA dehydratase n=1 Tax=Clonostachys solani TaxID=160281 RepID=A0A9P0ENB4_9HYPO|nr:unnamed protein product [Clonostachys solani]
MTVMPVFTSAAPALTMAELSFPLPSVMLVTINRERAMNAIPMAGHWEGQAIWDWFDGEPSLTVAVLTGKGHKSFSAGADLMEVRSRTSDKSLSPRYMPPGGFFGISRRVGKKPIIAAVNGFALGGGFEMALNCDLVIASPTATFGLTEVKRGLYAAAGGLPRLVRVLGMQLASELALTGKTLTAEELRHFGFLRVAQSQDSLLEEAIQTAQDIASQSPDAVIVTRAALRDSWETASVERSSQLIEQRYKKALLEGKNLKIGLEAFARKEKPNWVPSQL